MSKVDLNVKFSLLLHKHGVKTIQVCCTSLNKRGMEGKLIIERRSLCIHGLLVYLALKF